MSDTTTIDEIMEDMYGEYKNSSESYCLIPNRVRHILTRHLAPQPSVSEMIKKREKKSKSMNQKHHSDIIDEFLADLSHLKPQSEELTATQARIINKVKELGSEELTILYSYLKNQVTKPREEKGEEICIRCGLDKKIVKKEGSNGCYLYGDKMANTHLRHKPKRSNHKK